MARVPGIEMVRPMNLGDRPRPPVKRNREVLRRVEGGVLR